MSLGRVCIFKLNFKKIDSYFSLMSSRTTSLHIYQNSFHAILIGTSFLFLYSWPFLLTPLQPIISPPGKKWNCFFLIRRLLFCSLTEPCLAFGHKFETTRTVLIKKAWNILNEIFISERPITYHSIRILSTVPLCARTVILHSVCVCVRVWDAHIKNENNPINRHCAAEQPRYTV